MVCPSTFTQTCVLCKHFYSVNMSTVNFRPVVVPKMSSRLQSQLLLIANLCADLCLQASVDILKCLQFRTVFVYSLQFVYTYSVNLFIQCQYVYSANPRPIIKKVFPLFSSFLNFSPSKTKTKVRLKKSEIKRANDKKRSKTLVLFGFCLTN